jgi:hypothetical protein
VNTSEWEISPHVSADELSLFFASERSTNLRGGTDLYVSTRTSKNDPWQPAVNLGSAINSSRTEESPPFLTADGTTFYFSRYTTSENVDNDIWQVSVLPFESQMIWTATTDDVVFQNQTTREFPGHSKSYVGVYNAGNPDASDRSLATGRTSRPRRTTSANSGNGTIDPAI